MAKSLRSLFPDILELRSLVIKINKLLQFFRRIDPIFNFKTWTNYDSVDHNYMQGVLEAYGFGPKCKNWFKLLSKNLKANILVNGFTMEIGKY